MSQCNRFCKMKGHEEQPKYFICTLLECNLPTRWCCSDCIQQGFHNHNKPNNSHVKKTNELLIKLKNESEKLKEQLESHKTYQLLNLLEKIFEECKGLENCIIDYRKKIESQIQMITQQQTKFKSYVNNLVLNNFEQLDDIRINKLLNMNIQQFNLNQQLLPPDNIESQLQSIKSIIKDFQNNKNANSNYVIDQKNRKYLINEIDQAKYLYGGSQISKNEKYLAYGDCLFLKIYDIQSKQIIKQIELRHFIEFCQFTQDSSQLYLGLSHGHMYGYDVQKDFKQIYRQRIHSSEIYNIITLQNQYLITCSHDRSIIKTDIKRKKKIFKLTGHTSLIRAIDYNHKDEIIVSGSEDSSIKLWNCRNQSIIINKQQSRNCGDIIQIQLINNNFILSLGSSGNLYKWKIDLINKDLIKLQQFSDQNEIFNFYYNQDQNLLLICKNYVQIINQQGKTINTIQHDSQDKCWSDCRQLDNLKYIQILTKKKIILAIAQD